MAEWMNEMCECLCVFACLCFVYSHLFLPLSFMMFTVFFMKATIECTTLRSRHVRGKRHTNKRSATWINIMLKPTEENLQSHLVCDYRSTIKYQKCIIMNDNRNVRKCVNITHTHTTLSNIYVFPKYEDVLFDVMKQTNENICWRWPFTIFWAMPTF